MQLTDAIVCFGLFTLTGISLCFSALIHQTELNCITSALITRLLPADVRSLTLTNAPFKLKLKPSVFEEVHILISLI